jgi:hypothetical protein
VERAALEDDVSLSMTSVSPDQPVRRFAEIMAALADPFVNRVTVLSAAGHDASSWDRIEREWTERIKQDATGELGAAYGAAFSRASARQTQEKINQPPTERARFLNSAAQSWRHEAAGVQLDAHGEAPPLLGSLKPDPNEDTWPREPSFDHTAELRVHPSGPALPFPSFAATDESGARPASAGRRLDEAPLRPALDATERTMDIPPFAVSVPALPFTAEHQPCRRLHRFDTQTGLPLPIGHWVYDPKDPTKST